MFSVWVDRGEDRKAITGANNKSETCGLFQNVLVLLGVFTESWPG